MKNKMLPSAVILRKKAEKLSKNIKELDFSQLSEYELQKLVHEFNVYKIELEIQNEELKLANEISESASQKYIELFDFAPMGYFVLSKEGKIMEVNISGAKLLGREPSLLVNSLFGFFVSKESKLMFNQFLDNSYKTNSFEKCEITLSIDNNPPVYVLIKSLVSNKEQCLLSVVNITEQKKAEKIAFEKESIYHSILNASPDIIAMVNIDGCIRMISPAALLMYGVKKEVDIIGRNLLEFIVPEDRSRAQSNMLRMFSEKVGSVEYSTFRADGSCFYSEVNGDVICDFDGQPAGFMFIIRDITRRKKAEVALLESEEKYRSLVQYSSDPIFSFNPDETYRYVNEAFAQPFGKKPEEIIGKLPHSIFPFDEAEKRLRLVRQVFNTGRSGEIEVKVVTHTGDIRYYLTMADPIKDIEGNILYVSCTSKDISLRKLAEQEINRISRLYALLGQINQAISRIHDKDRLFKKICEVAVEFGNFSMAWVGIYDETSHRFNPLTQAGTSVGYLDNFIFSLDNEAVAKGIIGSTLMSGELIIINNIETNPILLPLKDEALKQGFKSFAAVPFRQKEKIFGTLNLYTKELDFFKEDEIKLLQEISEDISYALDAMELDAEKKLAEKELENSRVELKKYATHLQTVREEEKKLLAREIHDELGQLLIVLKIDLGLLKLKVLKDNKNIVSQEILTKFDLISGLVDNSIKTTRKIMTGLRPEVIEILGFIEAIKLFTKEFQERYKISCHYDSIISKLEINSNLSVGLFRILQEALSNVVRHSEATAVKVLLFIEDDKLIMEIIDNGLGLDVDKIKNPESYGIIGMKERAFLLDGKLTISGNAGKGTKIRIEMPHTIIQSYEVETNKNKLR